MTDRISLWKSLLQRSSLHLLASSFEQFTCWWTFPPEDLNTFLIHIQTILFVSVCYPGLSSVSCSAKFVWTRVSGSLQMLSSSFQYHPPPPPLLRGQQGEETEETFLHCLCWIGGTTAAFHVTNIPALRMCVRNIFTGKGQQRHCFKLIFFTVVHIQKKRCLLCRRPTIGLSTKCLLSCKAFQKQQS